MNDPEDKLISATYVAYPRDNNPSAIADRVEHLADAYFGLYPPFLASAAYVVLAGLVIQESWAKDPLVLNLAVCASVGAVIGLVAVSIKPCKSLLMGTGKSARWGVTLAVVAAVTSPFVVGMLLYGWFVSAAALRLYKLGIPYNWLWLVWRKDVTALTTKLRSQTAIVAMPNADFAGW